ncbi:MAG: M17 family metallopeptidase, partial [Cytophagales bacterium]
MIEFLFEKNTSYFDFTIEISSEPFTKDDFKLKVIDNKPIINLSFKQCNISHKKEKIRKSAIKCLVNIRDFNAERVILKADKDDFIPFFEGVFLNSYVYEHSKSEKSPNKTITFVVPVEIKEKIETLKNLFQWVNLCRDWVNEPYNSLNAITFAQKMENTAISLNINSQILEQKQIESLKMGGLIAVNKGSTCPPTFTILEHKPEYRLNEKPIVLVGKGVVMDTGGYTLKDTPNSMEIMKCDMSGGAIVSNIIFAVASEKLPIWCISLIPATDNMVGPNALVPGEVITMSDGKTVEVLNADAEGRLILADALVYAKKFDPELVIDVATLTGSAISTIGQEGAVLCAEVDEKTKQNLKIASEITYERWVELP